MYSYHLFIFVFELVIKVVFTRQIQFDGSHDPNKEEVIVNKDEIFQILGEIIDCDKQTLMQCPPNQNLSDLNLDSIKFIQFIVAVEEAFNIEISDSDLLLSNFETLEKLVSTLEKYFNPTCLKKVLVCDCDNVLWHGIAGEETIWIDSDTQNFHKTMIDLYHKGILLCLCSKNEESNIRDAFNQLNLRLTEQHFAITKINFQDKASNIKQIALELNLTPDSFVFVDDSDYELGLISALIPEVYTIKANYPNKNFIQKITSLFEQNTPSMNRTELYREQKEREKEKIRFSSVEEYNNSLRTQTIFQLDTSEDAQRIAELTQRTNQFNLSGSRYTQQQILDIIKTQNYHVLTLSVSDKYGDMGIIGTMIYEITKDVVILHAFYLSCRAFGRNFENLMLNEIKKIDKPVYGIYKQTEKNQKHQLFYKQNGVYDYEP